MVRYFGYFMIGVIIALIGYGAFFVARQSVTRTTMTMGHKADTTTTDGSLYEANAVATFAGGCFWCMEAAIQEQPGVVEVISGYAGGTEEQPTYEDVYKGRTGHREAVQVHYDSQVISYDDLLTIFWQGIDPTDDGGQFSDRGESYTTAIFYHNDAQKNNAEASKKALEESGRFDTPIVTEILPFTTFYLAEEYHQDFYKKSSLRYSLYKNASGREGFKDKVWQDIQKEQSAKHGEYHKPSNDQIKDMLTDEQYKVTQENGTEKPFANAYWDNHDEGIYIDVVTGEPLFSSTDKYDSGTGWPSFTKPIVDKNVVERQDLALYLPRTEVRSAVGDSHLGHVFGDGPAETGGQRYCINSAALRFVPRTDMAQEGYDTYLYLFEK